MKKRKGFTLVELLVVIAILAILSTVAIISYNNFTKKANMSVLNNELSQISLELVANDYIDDNYTITSNGISKESSLYLKTYLDGCKPSDKEFKLYRNDNYIIYIEYSYKNLSIYYDLTKKKIVEDVDTSSLLEVVLTTSSMNYEFSEFHINLNGFSEILPIIYIDGVLQDIEPIKDEITFESYNESVIRYISGVVYSMGNIGTATITAHYLDMSCSATIIVD